MIHVNKQGTYVLSTQKNIRGITVEIEPGVDDLSALEEYELVDIAIDILKDAQRNRVRSLFRREAQEV